MDGNEAPQKPEFAASVTEGPLPPSGEPDDFTPRYLDPATTRLFRSPAGTPRLELEGEVCYQRIVPRRLLPLSEPDRYIALWAGEEVEIGIVRDPTELDSECLKIFYDELEKRYFTPVIQRIHKVKERFGTHEWDVVTSRGKMTFSVQGLHQNVKQIPPARLLVTDVRGNRYDIPDVNALDPSSYEQIQRHL